MLWAPSTTPDRVWTVRDPRSQVRFSASRVGAEHLLAEVEVVQVEVEVELQLVARLAKLCNTCISWHFQGFPRRNMGISCILPCFFSIEFVAKVWKKLQNFRFEAKKEVVVTEKQKRLYVWG